MCYRWLISANAKKYNHKLAFDERGYVYWKQIRRFQPKDYVYIYCTMPIGQILYQAVVADVGISSKKLIGEEKYYLNKEFFKDGIYIKLQLLKKNSTSKLKISDLKNFGFMPPQGPQRIRDMDLLKYIEEVFEEQ